MGLFGLVGPMPCPSWVFCARDTRDAKCHGSHISECYCDSKVDSAVGHDDEDVDTISGGECHGSHIDKCYRDSVGTSMRLRGSLSVEGRELKS
ncbi:unnamed protein product [Prunus armeniaca]